MPTTLHRVLPVIVPLAAAALVGACVSSTATSSAPQSRTPPAIVERAGEGFYFRLQGEGSAAAAEFGVPLSRVWSALPAAYDSLGIELSVLDPAMHTIGNQSFTVTRRLGDAPLTQYIQCGQGAVASASASNYRVRVSVVTSLSETPTGYTRMETAVSAVGTPLEGASRASTPCRSTGRLEQRLAEAVRARLAASGGS